MSSRMQCVITLPLGIWRNLAACIIAASACPAFRSPLSNYLGECILEGLELDAIMWNVDVGQSSIALAMDFVKNICRSRQVYLFRFQPVFSVCRGTQLYRNNHVKENPNFERK